METEDLDFDPLEYEYSNFAPDWEIEAEEHRYSYHNSEAEIDETGDWERIDL
jgi:hypothetical protein